MGLSIEEVMNMNPTDFYEMAQYHASIKGDK